MIAGVQNGDIHIWCYIPDVTASSTVERRFRIYGTGQPIGEEKLIYIGTAFDGQFVWHIFEEED